MILGDKHDIYGKTSKTDPYNKAEYNASAFDIGHVFRMIGTNRLECTPKTMTRMNGRNDHGNNINKYISRFCERARYDLENGRIRFIYEMKVGKVENNK